MIYIRGWELNSDQMGLSDPQLQWALTESPESGLTLLRPPFGADCSLAMEQTRGVPSTRQHSTRSFHTYYSGSI